MCMALPRGGSSEPPGGALRQLGRLFAFAALFAWLLGAGVAADRRAHHIPLNTSAGMQQDVPLTHDHDAHRIQAHFGGPDVLRQQLATLCQQIDFDLTDVRFTRDSAVIVAVRHPSPTPCLQGPPHQCGIVTGDRLLGQLQQQLDAVALCLDHRIRQFAILRQTQPLQLFV